MGLVNIWARRMRPMNNRSNVVTAGKELPPRWVWSIIQLLEIYISRILFSLLGHKVRDVYFLVGWERRYENCDEHFWQWPLNLNNNVKRWIAGMRIEVSRTAWPWTPYHYLYVLYLNFTVWNNKLCKVSFITTRSCPCTKKSTHIVLWRLETQQFHFKWLQKLRGQFLV